MRNPLQFLFRSRDKPRDAVSGAPTFYFGTSASGKAVNPRNAFFNDYDYVSFEQDNEHKDMFNVLFSKNYDTISIGSA